MSCKNDGCKCKQKTNMSDINTIEIPYLLLMEIISTKHPEYKDVKVASMDTDNRTRTLIIHTR